MDQEINSSPCASGDQLSPLFFSLGPPLEADPTHLHFTLLSGLFRDTLAPTLPPFSSHFAGHGAYTELLTRGRETCAAHFSPFNRLDISQNVQPNYFDPYIGARPPPTII